jgi:hypothetical protein
MDKEHKLILESKGILDVFYNNYLEKGDTTQNCSFVINKEYWVDIFHKGDILLHTQIDYESSAIDINWITAEQFFMQVYNNLENKYAEYKHNVETIRRMLKEFDITVEDIKEE